MTLESLIKHYVLLPRPTASGFHTLYCVLCGDRTRPRAGFSFPGDCVVYCCFNCGFKVVQPNSEPIGDRMRSLLTRMGIPTVDLDLLSMEAFRLSNNPRKVQSPILTIMDPAVIPLPTHFKALNPNNTDRQSLIALDYLESRGIDPGEYPFYTSHNKSWKHRLLIPIYNNKGDLVFYQGRSLLKSIVPKYRSPTGVDCKLFGFDKILEHSNAPLLITEGFFDAFGIGGIALLGKSLHKEQIAWLNRSNRRKVVIPDKTGGGHKLAEKALGLGWSISTPDIGDCTDIGQALVRFGRVFTVSEIMKSINDNPVLLGLYCMHS